MIQRALEGTRTPNRPCLWEARAVLGRRVFVARSRHGAPFELARKLVDDGVHDVPVEVGGITHPSLHRMAERTVVESATVSVRRGRYVPPEERFPLLRTRDSLA
jgi:hypothetical protein